TTTRKRPSLPGSGATPIIGTAKKEQKTFGARGLVKAEIFAHASIGLDYSLTASDSAAQLIPNGPLKWNFSSAMDADARSVFKATIPARCSWQEGLMVSAAGPFSITISQP